MDELKKVIEELEETYGFNDNLKSFKLVIADCDGYCTVTCLLKDTYGISHKSLFLVSSLENYNPDALKSWIKTLINGIACVKRLNDTLKIIYDDMDGIHVYYRFSLKNEFKSYIYDWDYDRLLISLSRKSISQLCSIIDTLDITRNNISEFECFSEFMSKYRNYYIGSLINLELETDNIYQALSKHMLDRKDVIEMLDELHNTEKKAEVISVLASESLGIVCKFKWEVDYESLDVKVSILDNKIYSIKNKEFIRDSEILSGIEKLYKPIASEISDIFT